MINGKTMTLGSLFDGIGGFPLAASMNNIKTLWTSDIEPSCESVTAVHFPEAIQLGDITKIDGGKIPPVDIISGGSPCQDLSVAGKRAGLDGERSGLFMDQMRIVRQMRKATDGKQPRYMVWENVPGAFSSNKGDDFHAIIDEIVYTADTSRGGCGDSIPRPAGWRNAGAVLGDGFSIAWRVLDAQFWGVPQRRRRIFLVADFGGETAPKILFERKGERRYFETRREARERAAGAFKESIGGSGVDGRLMQPKSAMEENWSESDVCNALRAGESKSARAVIQIEGLLNDQGGSIIHPEDGAVSPTIRAQTKGNEPIIYGFSPKQQSMAVLGEASPPIMANDYKEPNSVCYSVDCRNTTINPEIHGTLQAKENGGQSLNYSGAIIHAIDHHQQDSRFKLTKDGVIPTLRATMGTGGNNGPMVLEAYTAGNGQTNTIDKLIPEAARTLDCMHDQQIVLAPKKCRRYTIRRLTPIECERLQGFPDEWTAVIHQGRPMSDSARYRMLGNSIAVSCADFIFFQIATITEEQAS